MKMPAFGEAVLDGEQPAKYYVYQPLRPITYMHEGLRFVAASYRETKKSFYLRE